MTRGTSRGGLAETQRCFDFLGSWRAQLHALGATVHRIWRPLDQASAIQLSNMAGNGRSIQVGAGSQIGDA
jgi:hypothetical protein